MLRILSQFNVCLVFFSMCSMANADSGKFSQSQIQFQDSSAIVYIKGKDDQLVESINGEFQRIYVEPLSTIEVRVIRSRFDLKSPIILEANNGGRLNNNISAWQKTKFKNDISFSFDVGETEGLYTVELSQDNDRELFEFWVGGERPIGKPGPKRSFPK